jgi:hypothetical protein
MAELKSFEKGLLQKLAEAEEGVAMNGKEVVVNECFYIGRRHEGFKVVFREGEIFWSFNYYVSTFGCGEKHLGAYLVRDKHDKEDSFNCERVYRNERTQKVVSFDSYLREN